MNVSWSFSLRPSKCLQARITTSLGWDSNHSTTSLNAAYTRETLTTYHLNRHCNTQITRLDFFKCNFSFITIYLPGQSRKYIWCEWSTRCQVGHWVCGQSENQSIEFPLKVGPQYIYPVAMQQKYNHEKHNPTENNNCCTSSLNAIFYNDSNWQWPGFPDSLRSS